MERIVNFVDDAIQVRYRDQLQRLIADISHVRNWKVAHHADVTASEHD